MATYARNLMMFFPWQCGEFGSKKAAAILMYRSFLSEAELPMADNPGRAGFPPEADPLLAEYRLSYAEDSRRKVGSTWNSCGVSLI
ncbi:MAG: hypothetical protein WC381_06965 [Kiritimatiellia bacterium]|jgi:hypothetical protein